MLGLSKVSVVICEQQCQGSMLSSRERSAAPASATIRGSTSTRRKRAKVDANRKLARIGTRSTELRTLMSVFSPLRSSENNRVDRVPTRARRAFGVIAKMASCGTQAATPSAVASAQAVGCDDSGWCASLTGRWAQTGTQPPARGIVATRHSHPIAVPPSNSGNWTAIRSRRHGEPRPGRHDRATRLHVRRAGNLRRAKAEGRRIVRTRWWSDRGRKAPWTTQDRRLPSCRQWLGRLRRQWAEGLSDRGISAKSQTPTWRSCTNRRLRNAPSWWRTSPKRKTAATEFEDQALRQW